jgi:hypothetical protein
MKKIGKIKITAAPVNKFKRNTPILLGGARAMKPHRCRPLKAQNTFPMFVEAVFNPLNP